MFSVEELSADNCPRVNLNFLINICPRREALRATIRPIVPRHKHSISFIVHHQKPGQTDRQVVASGRKLNLRRDLR